MSSFQAIILGIVQGLTEFLPVSSTAHLLIAERIMGLSAADPSIFSFTVLVQLGTLLALIVYYWRDLVSILAAMLTGLRHKKPLETSSARLGWYLLLATVPALIAGVLFKPLVDKLFSQPLLETTIRLWLTAILLGIAERYGRQSRTLDKLHWGDSLWIGFAQVLSIFPGASRSGSTIFGGMLRNFDRSASARFAFLLSIPIMFAAGGYETFGLVVDNMLTGELLLSVVIGFVTATIVGYLAIRWLIHYLSNHSLYIFAIYCAAIGLITLMIGY
jgi:undecaprenyl-diphosphatase